MKIILGTSKFTIVEPTYEQKKAAEKFPTCVTVHEGSDGFTVSGDPKYLYFILHQLSYTYDVELV